MSELISRFILRPYWRLTRAMTLGVRGIVRDGDGGILLVRHSYTPGWHLPGGGVERGETMKYALHRELQEEGGVEPLGEPRLHGIFANRNFSGDHVAVAVSTQTLDRGAQLASLLERVVLGKMARQHDQAMATSGLLQQFRQ